MRILHILDHSLPLQSGYTFRTCSIIEQQWRMGWETAQLTSAKQGRTEQLKERIDGFEFYRTAPSKGWLSTLPIINQVEIVRSLQSRLIEVALEVKPDILHAHSPALNGLAAVKAGRRLGLPVVYEVRAFWEDAAVDHGTSRSWGPRYRATRALESYVLRHADAVTTICEGLRSEILQRGIAPQKVTVIPNAVNLDKFDASQGDAPAEAIKKQYGWQGKPVLGFIGSFYAYEGLELLLKAMPSIAARLPDARLLLVGGGPQETKLHQLADSLKIADKVAFSGRVPHQQIPAYYAAIDMLVYPRLPMRLTELVTPLKPLEAMAYERLVAASDVGGHRELISDGVTGILFKAGDIESLSRCVIEFLTSPALCQSLRANARSFVERERTWLRSVERYDAIYRSLTTDR